MFDYSEEIESASDDLLQKISTAAAQQGQLEYELAELEQRLEQKKAELRQVQEVIIPELMLKAGMSEITTATGYKVKIVDDVFASIPKARSAEALEWLNENGHSKLIKRVFMIRFGREDEAWARKFEADLRKRKQQVDCERADKVEPMTLKKWCREQLEAGVAFPMDLFGVHVRKVSKLSRKQ